MLLAIVCGHARRILRCSLGATPDNCVLRFSAERNSVEGRLFAYFMKALVLEAIHREANIPAVFSPHDGGVGSGKMKLREDSK
jgi:hypothetical protein